MESFNSLFEQAAIVADHRKNVFGKLIVKFKSDIAPGYCEAMKKLGYEQFTFVDFGTPVLASQEGSYDSNGSLLYPVAIFSDGSISTGSFRYDPNVDADEFFAEKNHPITEANFSKRSIVSLIKSMNFKLDLMIKKRDKQNKEAESLL